MPELIAILQALVRRRFFGTLEVQFQGGEIVLLRQCETAKPPFNNLQRDYRGSDEHKTQ